MTASIKTSLLALAGLFLSVSAVQAAEGFVAGTTPDRRPEGAPTVPAKGLSSEQRAAALRGVSEPYPPSLSFLDNQGGWYTPFNRPNMPAPYDIRNLYAKPK